MPHVQCLTPYFLYIINLYFPCLSIARLSHTLNLLKLLIDKIENLKLPSTQKIKAQLPFFISILADYTLNCL